VVEVVPVRIATTAPVAGNALRVAGFGRTTADWVPDRLHVGSFTVSSVTTATVNITGDQETPASVCKGDAGGPVVRGSGADLELIALNSTSWQARCHGTAASETRNGATETRLDNVRDWVRRTVRGSNFVRLPKSAQVLDTRGDLGGLKGPRPGGSTSSFQVTGVGGLPSTGVTAVLVDLAAVTTTDTFLTLHPDGTPPATPLSMLNAGPNQVLSNTAVVPVPPNGKLSVYNNAGDTHVMVDVQGYYTSTPTEGGGFVPVDYTRLVDTRNGTGGSTGIVPPGGSRTFKLTGTVIPNGASSAFVDLIVTDAAAQGWIGAVAPGGANDRSIMDYAVGTTSHGVAMPLASDGRVTVTNNGGSAVHFVMTATGYTTADPLAGGGLRVLPGARKLDTRQVGTEAPLDPNATVDVALGVPAGTAALVNLTVFANLADGNLQAWPVDGPEMPHASLTNYPRPNTTVRSGLAVVRVGTGGKIRIRNVSAGTTHLIVDLQGWYAVPPGGTAAIRDAQDVRSAAAADAPGSVVEDYLYPNAAQILEEQNIRLISGDGHIVLADCATPIPPNAEIGLLWVHSTDVSIGDEGAVCFKVRASTGILNLEVPGVYEIRGDGLRTGAGHKVTAELVSDTGEELTVEIDPDGSTPVGEGEGQPPTTLLRLTAHV
jgi:hypothetical protein